MSLAVLMVITAALMGPLTAALAKAGGSGFDNRAPRAWLEGLEGWRKRADWAQRNHYEVFAPFAVAVALALAAGARADMIGYIAAGFVAARVAYTGFYLANLATLRSIAWAVGLIATMWIFVIAARTYG